MQWHGDKVLTLHGVTKDLGPGRTVYYCPKKKKERKKERKKEGRKGLKAVGCVGVENI
jgi:hypothetical protein